MKENHALMRLALVVIAACMLACSARSQDRMDARLRALVQQFERLTSKGWDTGSRQQAVEAAQEYLDALGASGARPVYECMIEDLRRHSSGPFLLADTSVTRLLDEVKFQRTRGWPARMIPPLPADEGCLAAMAAMAHEAVGDTTIDRWVFSFHGVPERRAPGVSGASGRAR